MSLKSSTAVNRPVCNWVSPTKWAVPVVQIVPTSALMQNVGLPPRANSKLFYVAFSYTVSV